MDLTQLFSVPIGLTVVPLCITLGEILRWWQRAEQFAAEIFAKRLEAYDTLLALLYGGYQISNGVIENPELSSAEQHELISAAIMRIAEHTMHNIFYINEELGAHCTTLFMGVEDLRDLPEPEQKQRLLQFRSEWKETRRMILEDSGAIQVNYLFRGINRPRITSPLIDRIRELRRQQK